MKKGDEDGWRGFLNLCLRAESLKQLEKLFDCFLTFEEKENLTTRYLLVKELLEKKKTQREIASELGISISKLTRGSNALKTISDSLRRFLEKNTK